MTAATALRTQALQLRHRAEAERASAKAATEGFLEAGAYIRGALALEEIADAYVRAADNLERRAAMRLRVVS